jgi:imidazolonepropionase-like amidohydrolase
VPARSLEIDYRVGFVKPGYDADLVVWDSFPLSVGATAEQVYIDGKPTLNTEKVAESRASVKADNISLTQKPKMRKVVAADVKEQFCSDVKVKQNNLVIKGITQSYLDLPGTLSQGNLTMVIKEGNIACFDSDEQCSSVENSDSMLISLYNGHVLPGLLAVSTALGLNEISGEDSTGDGSISKEGSSIEQENVIYAKYGVRLQGKAFDRARIGGITKAITAPISHGGFAGGVSVGIRTREQKVLSLDDGIFQDDVALHFALGETSKSINFTIR